MSHWCQYHESFICLATPPIDANITTHTCQHHDSHMPYALMSTSWLIQHSCTADTMPQYIHHNTYIICTHRYGASVIRTFQHGTFCVIHTRDMTLSYPSLWLFHIHRFDSFISIALWRAMFVRCIACHRMSCHRIFVTCNVCDLQCLWPYPLRIRAQQRLASRSLYFIRAWMSHVTSTNESCHSHICTFVHVCVSCHSLSTLSLTRRRRLAHTLHVEYALSVIEYMQIYGECASLCTILSLSTLSFTRRRRLARRFYVEYTLSIHRVYIDIQRMCVRIFDVACAL